MLISVLARNFLKSGKGIVLTEDGRWDSTWGGGGGNFTWEGNPKYELIELTGI